ncbi:hypothetical protein ACP70R_002827 [Stipagrostis hirtigluma subsp. patula]
MESNLADLPEDIVRGIADRVAPECRPRMRAICSAFSAAVPAEPQPWIVLQPDDDIAERDQQSGSFSVMSLPANRKLRLSRPCSIPGARCLGAGHGWLALVGGDLSVTLHNPLSDRSVSLPPLTRHPMVGGVRDDGRVLWRSWLGVWPNSGDLVAAEELRDTFVRKIVFSPRPDQDGYFAVAISDRRSYAMYARAGSTAWRTLRDAHGHPVSLVHDVVHVEGSRFFAVTRCHGKVLALDLAVQAGVGAGGDHDADQDHQAAQGGVDDDSGGEEEDVHDRYSPSVSVFAGPLALAETIGYFSRGTDMHVENHVVLVDGELHQIWASWVIEPAPEEDDSDGDYRIEEVGVVKCDLDQCACWAEVADLGDWAVLVGRNETVAVRAGDVPGVRGSCVYFIDNRLKEMICAFDTRSGRVETVECDMLRDACSTSRLSSPPPMWLLPSLK